MSEPLDHFFDLAETIAQEAFREEVGDYLLLVFAESRVEGPSFRTLAGGPLPVPERPRVHRVAKRPGSNPFAGMVTLGRAGNNDLVLDFDCVSKFHAYFVMDPTPTIVDSGSTNGTVVAGVRLERALPTPVESDQGISFGGLVTQLLHADAFYELCLAKRCPPPPSVEEVS